MPQNSTYQAPRKHSVMSTTIYEQRKLNCKEKLGVVAKNSGMTSPGGLERLKNLTSQH